MSTPSSVLHQSAIEEVADHAAGRKLAEPASTAAPTTELASAKIRLEAALRRFPDFPIPGIDFVDILPIFADPKLQETLLLALELQVAAVFHTKPDVIVALDARGFLFGPGLALRLGCRFAPVRKKGKLPGPVETATYMKEYGEDLFQMQKDAVAPGQTVVIVDDIIATGGSAQAAATLVEKLGGTVMGYLFILEVEFLRGCDKLAAPAYTLLSG